METMRCGSSDPETDTVLALYVSRHVDYMGDGLPRWLRLVVPTDEPPENFERTEMSIIVEALHYGVVTDHDGDKDEVLMPHRFTVILEVVEAHRDGEDLCLLCRTDVSDRPLTSRYYMYDNDDYDYDDVRW